MQPLHEHVARAVPTHQDRNLQPSSIMLSASASTVACLSVRRAWPARRCRRSRGPCSPVAASCPPCSGGAFPRARSNSPPRAGDDSGKAIPAAQCRDVVCLCPSGAGRSHHAPAPAPARDARLATRFARGAVGPVRACGPAHRPPGDQGARPDSGSGWDRASPADRTTGSERDRAPHGASPSLAREPGLHQGVQLVSVAVLKDHHRFPPQVLDGEDRHRIAPSAGPA